MTSTGTGVPSSKNLEGKARGRKLEDPCSLDRAVGCLSMVSADFIQTLPWCVDVECALVCQIANGKRPLLWMSEEEKYSKWVYVAHQYNPTMWLALLMQIKAAKGLRLSGSN